MTSTDDLVKERKSTHGSWDEQATIAQMLKSAIHSHTAAMSPTQLEAVEMICVKISRICCGNPHEPDHWNDIMGYALLGRGGHSE